MMFIKKTLILFLACLLFSGVFAIEASASQKTMYGIGFVDASNLRLREAANTTSATLTMAPRNECVVVISKSGQWYKVNYNLQEGYMHEDYLKVATRENAELGYGTIHATDVNLRSGPSTSHSIVDQSSKGDKCYIIGLNNGWYKVIYDGKTCYIRSDFVSLTEIPYENKASSKSPKYFRGGKPIGSAPTSGNQDEGSISPSASAKPPASGSQILAEAQKHLGVRYVNGGASPSGFDCSGFVYYVLLQSGYSPSRTISKLYKQGTYIERNALKPGDVVFFANTYASGLSHVGFYAGNGQFIHAPNSRSVVSYSDMSEGYWANHYYGAIRMG